MPRNITSLFRRQALRLHSTVRKHFQARKFRFPKIEIPSTLNRRYLVDMGSDGEIIDSDSTSSFEILTSCDEESVA